MIIQFPMAIVTNWQSVGVHFDCMLGCTLNISSKVCSVILSVMSWLVPAWVEWCKLPLVNWFPLVCLICFLVAWPANNEDYKLWVLHQQQFKPLHLHWCKQLRGVWPVGLKLGLINKSHFNGSVCLYVFARMQKANYKIIPRRHTGTVRLPDNSSSNNNV